MRKMKHGEESEPPRRTPSHRLLEKGKSIGMRLAKLPNRKPWNDERPARCCGRCGVPLFRGRKRAHPLPRSRGTGMAHRP